MVGEAIESRVGVSGGWELRGFKVQGFRLWALCFVLADSVCCFAGSQVLRSFRVSDVECRFVFVAGFTVRG